MTMSTNQTHFFGQIKKKQEVETEHEFVENVPIPPVTILPTNSEVICRPCQFPLLSISLM
jgi:hypothetical protein